MSVVVIACALSALLSSSPAVRLDGDDGVQPLLPMTEVLVDTSGTLTVDEARRRDDFVAVDDVEVSRGLGHVVFWARVRVDAAEGIFVDDSWSLRAHFPRPHEIDLWTVDAAGVVVAHERRGLLVRDQMRGPVADDAMVLPLSVPVGTHYLRVVAEPARMSIDVATDRAFAAVRHREGLFAGLYYGIFVGLLCFNFLFGVATRDPAHLLYCLFLVCIALHMGVRDGWLPDELPRSIFLGAGMTLTSLASTAFARRFLGIESSSSPKLSRAFNIGLVAALLFTIPPLLGIAFARESMIVTLVNIVIMVIAAVDASRRGSRPAQLFLLAWTLLIGSVVLAILHALKIIDAPWTTTSGVRIGAALEMVLLALALATRVGVLREQKERAELDLKDTILAQQDAVTRTMIEAQEAERVRFARDLHDGIGHSLLLIKQTALRDAPALADDVQAVLDDARGIARSIMPTRLDSAGLADALRALADGHAAATGADVDVVIDDAVGAASAVALGTRAVHAFRIAQEALSNATRHGGADHALVTLDHVGDTFVLAIVDNGVGMPTHVVDGVGLTGMRQRAKVLSATITIGDRDDGKRGTRIALTIPAITTPTHEGQRP